MATLALPRLVGSREAQRMSTQLPLDFSDATVLIVHAGYLDADEAGGKLPSTRPVRADVTPAVREDPILSDLANAMLVAAYDAAMRELAK